MEAISILLSHFGIESLSCFVNEVNSVVKQLETTDASSTGVENSVSGLSENEKDELHPVLQRAIESFTSKVNEIAYPVLNLSLLQDELRKKPHEPSNFFLKNADEDPNKEAKSCGILIQSCSPCDSVIVTLPETRSENKRSCDVCGGTMQTLSEDFFGLKLSHSELAKDEDPLNYVKQCELSLVLETLKPHSDFLLESVNQMETYLETIIDSIASLCSPMSNDEKQTLLDKIEKLPSQYSSGVENLLQKQKRSSSDDTNIATPEFEDTANLLRLLYYVEAVERIMNTNS